MLYAVLDILCHHEDGAASQNESYRKSRCDSPRARNEERP